MNRAFPKSPSFFMSLLCPALLLLAPGCKQGIGDRCQVNTDCQDNLVCVLPAGVPATEGGTCQSAVTMTSDGGADLAMSIDGTTSDLVSGDQATMTTSDLSLPSDGPSPDGSPFDDGVLDFAVVDMPSQG